ncbi:hypothetical protein SNE40_003936 [Patella caerulea]|uniref:Uncharacterized protein n=1 Tax=Patella caerulea TaxID=87958 RepID=A0AAN8KC90_PATCE
MTYLTLCLHLLFSAGLSRPSNRLWDGQRRLDNQGRRRSDSGGVLSHRNERMNGGRRMVLTDRNSNNGNNGNGQLFERNSLSNQGNMVDRRQNNRNRVGRMGRGQNSQQNGQVRRQNNPNSMVVQNSQPNRRAWRRNNPNSMIVQNSQANGQVGRQNNPKSMIRNRQSYQQRLANQGNQGDQGTLFNNLASHIRNQSPSRSSQGLVHSNGLGSQVIGDRRRGNRVGNSNMWRNNNANMNYVY